VKRLPHEVLQMVLPSDPENLDVVAQFVREIDAQQSISPQVYPNILITLTEAVTTAIHHGNKADVNKKIAIHCKIFPSKLTFRISDEGNGFNHRKLPDPTTPERIDKEDGRGVFIMKQLSDKVSYRNKGRTVIIHFAL
jgi:serine/threonine-protein kinase RsbW